jgi:hypothetical protein
MQNVCILVNLHLHGFFVALVVISKTPNDLGFDFMIQGHLVLKNNKNNTLK